jgi:hypothetical protein
MKERIQEIVNRVYENVNIVFDETEIILSKKEWADDVFFLFEENKKEEAIKKIQEWEELIGNLRNIVGKVDPKINVWSNGEEVILEHKDWTKELTFPMEEDEFDSYSDEILYFFSLNYIPVKACYIDNYVEILVNHPDAFWGDGLSSVNLFPENEELVENKIHYELNNISAHFANLIELRQGYRELEVQNSFTTLKIYNINKVTGIQIDDPQFEDKLWYFAKSILFEISSKSSIAINFYELPEYEEEDYPFEDFAEVLNEQKNPFLRKQYDSDLIDYYHRAVVMSESEFKYLAFYQILECIFDEVYLHETVQDVKQIMNSGWFSSYNDTDITQIIEIVDKYNKSKNDREKLKLVLEKYFKGDVHEQAYQIANKEIIEILKNKLNKISRDTEFNDLQRVANIIYDFRCECTHSNRVYPFRTTFENTNEELRNYIELLKKVAERIIINYPSKLGN